jgi:hypothetical protein
MDITDLEVVGYTLSIIWQFSCQYLSNLTTCILCDYSKNQVILFFRNVAKLLHGYTTSHSK